MAPSSDRLLPGRTMTDDYRLSSLLDGISQRPAHGQFLAPKEAVGRSATITALQSPHVSVLGVTVMALSPVSSQFARRAAQSGSAAFFDGRLEPSVRKRDICDG